MNLTPASTFDGVYQLEVTDQVKGGFGGKSNIPNQNLLNRTEYLNDRVNESLRLSAINPVTGNYGILLTDFGKVVSVHVPSTTQLTLPPLSSSPKGKPLTINITDVGTSNTVPLNAAPTEIIENYLNSGDGINVYNLKQGCRIVLIATVTSWVVILKTEPVTIPVVNGFLPGDIVTTAVSTLSRTGYLLCDGAAVSRSTYSALFTAIGTLYGVGDGSTTFNVPNHRDLFLRTWNGGNGLDPGRAFGSYQADALKDHQHDYTIRVFGGGTYPNTSDNANSTGDIPLVTSGVKGADGGAAETRGKNVSVNTFIKY